MWLLILFISAFISSVSAQIYIGDSAVITVAGDAMIYDGTSHSDETNTKEKDLTVGKSEKTAAESKDFIAEIVNKTEKKQIKKVTVKADTPKKVFTPILPREFFSVSANDSISCTIASNESIPLKENDFEMEFLKISDSQKTATYFRRNSKEQFLTLYRNRPPPLS